MRETRGAKSERREREDERQNEKECVRVSEKERDTKEEINRKRIKTERI